ncbi:MAG: hypothetical protein ABSB70_10615 [Candidatus Velthaea sp.]
MTTVARRELAADVDGFLQGSFGAVEIGESLESQPQPIKRSSDFGVKDCRLERGEAPKRKHRTLERFSRLRRPLLVHENPAILTKHEGQLRFKTGLLGSEQLEGLPRLDRRRFGAAEITLFPEDGPETHATSRYGGCVHPRLRARKVAIDSQRAFDEIARRRQIAKSTQRGRHLGQPLREIRAMRESLRLRQFRVQCEGLFKSLLGSRKFPAFISNDP